MAGFGAGLALLVGWMLCTGSLACLVVLVSVGVGLIVVGAILVWDKRSDGFSLLGAGALLLLPFFGLAKRGSSEPADEMAERRCRISIACAG